MKIIYAESVGSTNDELKKMAQEGAEEGTVFIAGRQTAGRGRLGRSFESPAGMGAWVSVLLRPDGAEALAGLTCAAAVAVRRAVIRAAGLTCDCGPKIKWTNDLVLNGKKLCGILAESVCSGGGSGYAVVGAGLNVNQERGDFSEALRDKATSLFLETGMKRDCRPIAEAIAGGILEAYRELGSKRASYMDEYRQNCVTLGKGVEFMLDGQKRRGLAEAIDEEGALLIRLVNGSLFTLRFGEASVV